MYHRFCFIFLAFVFFCFAFFFSSFKRWCASCISVAYRLSCDEVRQKRNACSWSRLGASMIISYIVASFCLHNHGWYCCCCCFYCCCWCCSPFENFMWTTVQANPFCLMPKLIFSSILVASKDRTARPQNYTKYCNFPFQPKRVLVYGAQWTIASAWLGAVHVLAIAFPSATVRNAVGGFPLRWKWV